MQQVPLHANVFIQKRIESCMIKDGLNKEAAITAIVGLYETWKDARREKELIWGECTDNYNVYIDTARFENWPWRCQVADTFSQETADVIGSALRNALFPVNEQFMEIEGDDDLGRLHQKTFQGYADKTLRRMKFIERLGPWCKQLAVIGNAPLLLTWEQRSESRRKRVRERDMKTGAPTYTVKDERKKVYDGPGIEVLDALDVVFDPNVRHFSQTPFVRRSEMSLDKVQAKYKDLSDADLALLDENKSSKPTEPSDSLKTQRARVIGLTAPDPSLHPGALAEGDQVEVLELHGDIVIEGERHTEILGVVLNRKVLAWFDRITFWGGRSIIWGTYDTLWFTAFGKGPLEPVRGTQQLIDTFSCQKADVLNLITNGCFAYVDDGVIDPDTMFLAPRKGIEVGNIANIKELHPNANISLTYQEIEMLRGRGERSTGKSGYDKGQSPGGRRTAYEASLIRQGGGSRDIDVVKHLANDVLEYALEWMVQSIQQFKWDSGELGPNTNDVLLGEYHVNYLGADLTAMRQFEIQQFMLFMDMIGRYPAFAEAVNAPVLIQEGARLFHFRNPDVVKDPMVYAREQQQKKLMEEAAMMQGQGGRTSTEGMGGPGMPEPVDEEQAAELAGAGVE